MTWPELYKAKKKALEISNEIEKLLKEHNDLFKNEIASHGEKLSQETEETLAEIREHYNELISNIKNHEKQLRAKAKFLRRHNSRSFK